MARKKIHPDFPNYLFYDDGRIQNIQPLKYSPLHGKFISNPNYLKFKKFRVHPRWRHLFCGLVDKDGKPNVTVHIHKIVAQLFVPNPEGKLHVIHKNGNKKNNHYTNLKWVTQADINYIGEENGTRNMKKQAAIMRKNGGLRDWTVGEIQLLMRHKSKGTSWRKIASMLKRTPATVQVKYSTLKKNETAQ